MADRATIRGADRITTFCMAGEMMKQFAQEIMNLVLALVGVMQVILCRYYIGAPKTIMRSALYSGAVGPKHWRCSALNDDAVGPM